MAQGTSGNAANDKIDSHAAAESAKAADTSGKAHLDGDLEKAVQDESAHNDGAAPAGNTATVGGHDKVAMLSLRADGTPDQIAPEFIGDRESTLAATTEQFKQQAVSAADVAARAQLDADDDLGEQDPTVSALAEVHDAAAADAEQAAERAVEDLTR